MTVERPGEVFGFDEFKTVLEYLASEIRTVDAILTYIVTGSHEEVELQHRKSILFDRIIDSIRLAYFYHHEDWQQFRAYCLKLPVKINFQYILEQNSPAEPKSDAIKGSIAEIAQRISCILAIPKREEKREFIRTAMQIFIERESGRPQSNFGLEETSENADLLMDIVLEDLGNNEVNLYRLQREFEFLFNFAKRDTNPAYDVSSLLGKHPKLSKMRPWIVYHLLTQDLMQEDFSTVLALFSYVVTPQQYDTFNASIKPRGREQDPDKLTKIQRLLTFLKKVENL